MSSIRHGFSLAIQSLKANKLRSALSVLGTAIGITSIVVIMSAGQSLKESFTEQFEQFGADYIEIEIKVPNTNQASTSNAAGIAQGISITSLSLDDKDTIDALENVRASYGVVISQASVSSIFDAKRYSYWAVSGEFPMIDQAKIASGRFFSTEEEDRFARVVVLGSEAADTLFPNQDPIGQSVKIQNIRFEVIGIYEKRGSVSFLNLDENIYMPLRTAQQLLLGFDHLMAIFIGTYDSTQNDETAEEIRELVRFNHEITDPAKDDFAVTTSAEALGILNTIFDGITLVLILIASVALVVGGVGIMNIMYVAVQERIFEIGLRKAVGATPGKIRAQFLVEAIVVTFCGGVAGIILAVVMLAAMFFAAPYVGFAWPFEVSLSSIVLGVVFSTAVGLIFGYFPAKQAAALRPVEALTQQGS